MGAGGGSPLPDPTPPSGGALARKLGGQRTADDVVRDKLRAFATEAAKVRPPLSVSFGGAAILSRATARITGGKARFLELVYRAALDNASAAMQFAECFATLKPTEQARAILDDVCVAAGVRPRDVLLAVVSAAMDEGEEYSDLIAATTAPEIVRQMAKSAKRIGGRHAGIALKDRHALLQRQKFLPVPKGTTIHVSASANSFAAAAATSEPSVPSFLEDMTDEKVLIEGTVTEVDE